MIMMMMMMTMTIMMMMMMMKMMMMMMMTIMIMMMMIMMMIMMMMTIIMMMMMMMMITKHNTIFLNRKILQYKSTVINGSCLKIYVSKLVSITSKSVLVSCHKENLLFNLPRQRRLHPLILPFFPLKIS